MKKIYPFVLLGIIILLGGYILLTPSDEAIINRDRNQSFDINIDSLTYQLPDYSKICLPETRYDCSSNGCTRNKPSVFVLYDENINKVYRCDHFSCDGYNVTKDVSGVYTNLTPTPSNGSLIKLTEENKYVETASLGLDFFIYSGSCTNKK